MNLQPTGFAAFLRRKQFENELLRAEQYGYKYGTGELQGYNGGCQCHRGRGCSPWTKQGLYTEKMARNTANEIYRNSGRWWAKPRPNAEVDELRERFMQGFKRGLKER